MQNPFNKIGKLLFGKVKAQYKAIIFLITAIAAGHLCDDFYQAKFPIFKIAFGLVGLMIFSILSKQTDYSDDQE